MEPLAFFFSQIPDLFASFKRKQTNSQQQLLLKLTLGGTCKESEWQFFKAVRGEGPIRALEITTARAAARRVAGRGHVRL